VVDPELVRFVAVKNAHNFKRSDFVAKFVPSISKGVFASNGKAHSRQKRMIGPAFSSANLRGFLYIFQENTNKLVQLWSGQLKSINPGHFVDVEVIKDLSHLTLDVIGQSSFGYNFNTVLGGESKISEAFATVLQGINFKYIICKFLIPFFDYLPLAETRKIHSAKEIADNTVIEVIQERRKQKSEGSYAPVKKDLLDLLLGMYDEETDSRMDNEELRAQVFTFILAGNETTSVALAWTLYEVAKNPHIQERMRAELLETFPDDDNELTWEKLEKLQYMENVIKESLRLHSPADIVGRVALSDVEIGGYLVPKGFQVLFPVDAMQHSTHLWSNPEAFDPDRFKENDGQTSVRPFSFLPFGCGPRMCMGNKFAVLEMKVVLATLTKKFSFCEVPGCVVKEVKRGTIRPDGLKLRINMVE